MSDSPLSHETDPREMLQTMIDGGSGDTPEATMLRLLWMRREHPDAMVTTESLHIAHDRVVMRAAVSLPNGAAGSGIAAALVDDGSDWAGVVERTETMAISRALHTLGYMLRMASPVGAEASMPAAAPVQEAARESPASPPTPMTQQPAMDEPPAETPPRPRSAPPRMDETAPSVVNALRRAQRPAEASPAPVPQASAADGDDAHLEEYSWNTFWSRARELGLTPDKVTEALGRPAAQMTPKDAVAGLIAAGAWPNPDEA